MADTAAMGTKLSHYSPAKDGPFKCSRCTHFEAKSLECDHPEVIQDAKNKEPGLSLSKSGNAVVEAEGCCEYERKKSWRQM